MADFDSLPYPIPDGDDQEMLDLIESWRYRGDAVGWDAVIGHGPQIRRCQEVVERLRRPPELLARLRVRAGAGVVISGPSGVGKSLLARALAGALGRDTLIPPTSELTAQTIRRLYAQASKMPPVVIVLDEAEAVIGPAWRLGSDEQALRSLLAALDGVAHPNRGPITVALTTATLDELDEAAIRPGRLAPRLVLEAPSASEREKLLARQIEGLPTMGDIDLPTLVDRTVGWSGAELVTAIEEACSRSLLDHTDALRQDLLLEVIGERYVVRDEHPIAQKISEHVAIHEAGHAVYGYIMWQGEVASVELAPQHGRTQLTDAVRDRVRDVAELRRLAEMSLAGDAAERVIFGPDGVTGGSTADKRAATGYLAEALAATKAYDLDVLEGGSMSDRGSERMRAGFHAELEALTAEVYANAVRRASIHDIAITRLAQVLLDAPDRALSGTALRDALEVVLP